MWESLIDILTRTSFLELLLIFIAKIVEVTISTLRLILINKGYRNYGVVLALVEIFLWVFVASSVIMGLSESPMKGVAYGLGFAAGVYLGSTLEQKIAVGKVLIQAVLPYDKGLLITNNIRTLGFGATTLDAHGKDSKRLVVMVFANRRDSKNVVKEIKAVDDKAMIISSETSNLSGGYMRQIRHLIK